MLVIHDEQIAKKVRDIAERENRPVEDVLKTMVDSYSSESVEQPEDHPIDRTGPENKDAVIRRVRRKIYTLARKYWESVGDTAKASMSDEQLDEEFGAFDEEGVPRLKSELDSLEPPVGSLAYAAMISEQGNLRSGHPDLARRSKEILNEHFAEDFLRRMKGEDADR